MVTNNKTQMHSRSEHNTIKMKGKPDTRNLARNYSCLFLEHFHALKYLYFLNRDRLQ